jgi:hypothetical protein
MEKTVAELKSAIPFKETTSPGDVLLMLRETGDDDSPLTAAYAYVQDILRDPAKKDEWWLLHLTFLLVPPQPQVLILQTPHYTGQEIFTMGGKKVFIQALDLEQLKPPQEGEPDPPSRDKPKPGLRRVK